MAPNRSLLCFGIFRSPPSLRSKKNLPFDVRTRELHLFAQAVFFSFLKIISFARSRSLAGTRIVVLTDLLTYLVSVFTHQPCHKMVMLQAPALCFVGVDLKFHICSFRQCHAFLKVRKQTDSQSPKTVERFKMGVNSWIAIVSWYKQKGTKKEKCNSM